MDNSINHIDELIGKYLAGEASGEEIVRVEMWANESADNQRYLDHLRLIFQKAAAVTEWQTFDTDAAWTKLKTSLHKPAAKTVTLPRRDSSPAWWRIAASIVMVLGVGLFAYQLMKPGKRVEVIANRQTVADTLPDGSDVFLNKETKLEYAYNKIKKAHTVKLKGEAFFTIHHDDTKTFIVEIDNVFIRDIGTAFNVKAYPDSDIIEVVVEEGEVMFYTDSDSGVYLREKGKGIYNKKTKQFTIDQPEANVLSYKTKFFSFSNADLATVVASLNNVYDKKIVLAPNLGQCPLTVSFNNESLDQIVAVISETLGLEVKESNGQILLEGSGCANP